MKLLDIFKKVKRCKRCHSDNLDTFIVSNVITFDNLNENKRKVKHTNSDLFKKEVGICNHCGAYTYTNFYETKTYGTIDDFSENYKLEHRIFFRLKDSDSYTLDLYYKVLSN